MDSSTACSNAPIVNDRTNQDSLLLRLPRDVIIYRLFPFLNDGDAMDCFETCKQLFYTYTWHYRIKNEIDLKTLYTRPAFCSAGKGESAKLPRPKIIRGTLEVDHFYEIAKLLFNDRYRPVNSNEEEEKIYYEKRKIWEEVISDRERGIDSHNFLILPPAEFDSLEELDLKVYHKWTKLPSWPPNLRKLRYGCYSLDPKEQKDNPGIGDEKFPPKLVHLEIYRTALGDILEIEPIEIPNRLISLMLWDVSIKIPDSATANKYPLSLEHLSIAMSDLDEAKQNYFPSKLKSLTLYYLSSPLANLLPSTISELTLVGCSCALEVGDLPTGLQTLKIEVNLGFPVYLKPGLFPPTLRNVSIACIANHTLDQNILPEGLVEFEVEHGDIEFQVGSLPSSLKSLGLPRDFTRSLSTLKAIFDTIPNLSTLVFNNLTATNEVNVDTVPASVRCLKIKLCFAFLLSEFRGLSSLLIDRLEIGTFSDAGQSILRPKFFPKSLKELHFNSLYSNWDVLFLPESLPDTLEKLVLPPCMYPFVPGVLPTSLKYLKLRLDYRFPLTDLPPGLRDLYLDCGYSSTPARPVVRIPGSKMPSNLQIQLTRNTGYPIRRYMYIEPDELEPKPQAQPNKKRKVSAEDEDVTATQFNKKKRANVNDEINGYERT